MQITSFNPLIVTKNAAETIKLFEALGFEVRHKKTGINDEDITTVTMKNADGFRVSISHVDSIPQDICSIAMNVRDFDEAFDYLHQRDSRMRRETKLPTQVLPRLQ